MNRSCKKKINNEEYHQQQQQQQLQQNLTSTIKSNYSTAAVGIGAITTTPILCPTFSTFKNPPDIQNRMYATLPKNNEILWQQQWDNIKKTTSSNNLHHNLQQSHQHHHHQHQHHNHKAKPEFRLNDLDVKTTL